MKKRLILPVLSTVLILLIACSNNDATDISKQEKDLIHPIKYAKLLDVEEIVDKNAKVTEKLEKEK